MAGTLKKLFVATDDRGKDAYALRRPGYVDAKSLAANTAETFTVPNGARYVLFAGTADFYVNYSDTATVPGDTADGSASELNPAMRYIGNMEDQSAVASISVISAEACIVTASYWM